MSKYHKTITKPAKIAGSEKEAIASVQIDVYDILVAFGVTNPATQHAVKKLLMPGQRGAKSKLQDLGEAAQSIKRAIEIEEGCSDD